MSHGAGSSGGTSSDPVRKFLIGVLIAIVTIMAINAAKDNVPQPTGSIVALVLLVVGLVIGWKAIAGKSSASGAGHPPAGGHGGHGTEGGVIALCCLLFVGAVVFLFAEFTQVKLLNEKRVERIEGLRNVASSQGLYVTANPGGDWTSVSVPAGMNYLWVEQHPSEKIWVQIDNGVPIESSAQQTVKIPTRAGPITLRFRAQGQIPVGVKVYLTPVPR